MRFGSANWIEISVRIRSSINVDSDCNDFDQINDIDYDIKSIYFQYIFDLIELFRYKIDLLNDFNQSNVD